MGPRLGACWLLLLAQTVLAVPAAHANEVADPDAWIAQVRGLIERGEPGGLRDVLPAAVMPQQREQTRETARQTVGPLVGFVGERRPAYVDTVQDVRHGTTFRRLTLSAWYEGLDFVFYAFDFFRLERGWALRSFSFNSDFAEIMARPLPDP